MALDDRDLLAAMFKAKMEGRERRFQQLLDQYELAGPPIQPRWSSLAEMNAALKKQREAPKPTPVDKTKRSAEIQRELDIIRGVTPTPPGYKVDPGRVKQLMKELKEIT